MARWWLRGELSRLHLQNKEMVSNGKPALVEKAKCYSAQTTLQRQTASAIYLSRSTARGAGVSRTSRLPRALGRNPRRLMYIQRTVEFGSKYGVVLPEVERTLERLKHVPTNITPTWADIEEFCPSY
ncbi:hypothetical protein BX070DRAFT_249348 [Coemansia spiralis]|nr:hypothetical protein BX070DRAFT_249348 [Coemansia spiralis]